MEPIVTLAQEFGKKHNSDQTTFQNDANLCIESIKK